MNGETCLEEECVPQSVSKRKQREIDVTGGPLFPSILRYSLPVMFGSLIQVLFNAADTLVLGRLGSMNAVSSVGSTGSIVSLLVNTFVGLSAGTNVVLARLIGQNNRKEAKDCIDTSITFAAICGVILTGIGLLLSGWFLKITECPAECVQDAQLYLNLYFLAIPAIMVYNFGAAVIRVGGDTRRPLYYLIFSGLLNVVLNVILCLVWEKKVAAVAVATLASQILGAVLVMVQLCRSRGICSFSFRNLSFSRNMLWRVLKIGLPCGFNSSLYSISNMQIQSAINAWGPAAIAGNTAGATIEGLVASFTGAFGNAAVAFIGQNIGCGKHDRVKKSIWICTCCSTAFGLVLGLGLFSFGRELLNLYLPGEEEAIACGMIRMSHILAWYGVAAMRGVFAGVIQAFGYSSVPMCSSIVTTLIFRVIWMTFVYPQFMTLENLYLCYTISWCFDLAVHTVFFVIFYRRYLLGKIKKV